MALTLSQPWATVSPASWSAQNCIFSFFIQVHRFLKCGFQNTELHTIVVKHLL